MSKYLIEREIPGVGQLTDADLQAISQKSCSVIHELGHGIQWLHSYVTDDKIYCVYQSASEDLIRRHAVQGGFPANSIAEIRTTINPATASYSDINKSVTNNGQRPSILTSTSISGDD